MPGLAPGLVSNALLQHGIQRLSYSSERWLTHDAGVPLQIWSEFELGTVGRARVEASSHFLRTRYEALGLKLAEHFQPSDARLLGAAIELVELVPDLFEAVSWLTYSVHPLVPQGPGFDVSHSDPLLPFSIFISFPTGEEDAELRLAESIVHEAMHLQLSLIEMEQPLVRAEGGGLIHSPWQQAKRPIGGLVHGLYVFACIDAFLSEVGVSLDTPDQEFAAKRRRHIRSEVGEIVGLQGHDDLTDAGAALVEQLLARWS